MSPLLILLALQAATPDWASLDAERADQLCAAATAASLDFQRLGRRARETARHMEVIADQVGQIEGRAAEDQRALGMIEAIGAMNASDQRETALISERAAEEVAAVLRQACGSAQSVAP